MVVVTIQLLNVLNFATLQRASNKNYEYIDHLIETSDVSVAMYESAIYVEQIYEMQGSLLVVFWAFAILSSRNFHRVAMNIL